MGLSLGINTIRALGAGLCIIGRWVKGGLREGYLKILGIVATGDHEFKQNMLPFLLLSSYLSYE